MPEDRSWLVIQVTKSAGDFRRVSSWVPYGPTVTEWSVRLFGLEGRCRASRVILLFQLLRRPPSDDLLSFEGYANDRH